MAVEFWKSDFFQREKYSIIPIVVLLIFLMIAPFFLTDPNSAIRTLLLGLIFSSIYLTTSIGFSLIFGVAKQFKLSLGAYYIIGAYSMVFLQNAMFISPKTPFDIPIEWFFLECILVLPVIITLVFIYFVVKKFQSEIYYKIFLVISPFVSLAGIFILSQSYTYSFYSALAITCIAAAGWFLELNKKVFPTVVFIISLLDPLLYFLFSLLNSSSFIILYLNLVIVGSFITAVIAMLSDRYLLEKVRYSAVNVMIVTFAFAIAVQGFMQLMFYPADGTTFKAFGVGNQNIATIVPKSQIFNINFLSINIYTSIPFVNVFSCIVFIFVLIGLFLFIRYSRIGLAIKAVSQDEVASSLAGINIRKITAIVSGIGMGLVGLASILTSSFSASPIFSPAMGWNVLIFAIVIVTLGGLGSLGGTVVASIILGMSSVIISILHFTFILNIPFIGNNLFSITIDSSYSVLIPLVLVLIVMIIKPNGLFGKKEDHK